MQRGIRDRRAGLASKRISGHRPQRAKALVALGDARRAGRISKGLSGAGLVPVLAFSSKQVIDRLDEDTYSLVLLGVGETDQERTARLSRHKGPVVALGQGTSNLGVDVDDHVDVEAAPEEVVARCVAMVQISRPVQLPATLRWGPLELDPSKRTARWHGEPLNLTSIQFRMMELLVLAAGSLVSTAELSRHIWGPNTYEEAERIVAHIRRIRKRIEPYPSIPQFLLTVRGEGFRLADEEIEEPAIDVTFIEAIR